ncbi:MAG: hypothetical protein M1832_001369 [Thelocarpon impressellum]|nr:MAG: hypothetical protein M1832_001369 [Thelocarpon impressellum]
MSLAAPAGSSGRSRSKSPGRRERERDRSPAAPRPPRARSPRPEAERGQKYEYAAPTAYAPDPPSSAASYSVSDPSRHDARQQRQQPPPGGAHVSYAQPGPYRAASVSAAYAVPGQYVDDDPRRGPQQPHRHGSGPDYTRPAEYSSVAPPEQPPYASPGVFAYADPPDQHGRAPTSPRPGEASRHMSLSTSGNFNVSLGGHGQHGHGHGLEGQPQYVQAVSPQGGHGGHAGHHGYEQPHIDAVNAHGGRPVPHHAQTMGPGYASPGAYQYAQPDGRISYNYGRPVEQPPPPQQPHQHHQHRHHQHQQQQQQQQQQQRPPGAYAAEDSNIIEVSPGGGALGAPPSPGLAARMHRLSVGGGPGLAHGLGQHGLPPGSPLLEAYQGTYQSISPMPSPIMGARPEGGLDDLARLDDLGRLDDSASDSDARNRRRRREKRVKFYDPDDDARDLAEALRHRTLDAGPLIEILPALTHEQMLQLRTEYKKHAKMQGKGINIAKHVKMKTGNTAFGKVCYATALGRWESEAYWANFWYQSQTSKRELLIESLMGRTNAEISQIKDAFSDKRYGDSLERCMKAELKADKFRTAVLLVLEERRMEESNVLRGELVRQDVRVLYDALSGRSGGETAMIEVVVLRSDVHMREVLRVYEKTHGKNFAKEMLRKSTNLVGETLAHILNGLINRPVRDALLLHQAISAEASKDRTELLISRLVRYHWDRAHLERVKHEFRLRYGEELATALAEGTRGDFGDFCVELILRR